MIFFLKHIVFLKTTFLCGVMVLNLRISYKMEHTSFGDCLCMVTELAGWWWEASQLREEHSAEQGGTEGLCHNFWALWPPQSQESLKCFQSSFVENLSARDRLQASAHPLVFSEGCLNPGSASSWPGWADEALWVLPRLLWFTDSGLLKCSWLLPFPLSKWIMNEECVEANGSR